MQSNRSVMPDAGVTIGVMPYQPVEKLGSSAEIALYHALANLPEPKLTHEFC